MTQVATDSLKDKMTKAQAALSDLGADLINEIDDSLLKVKITHHHDDSVSDYLGIINTIDNQRELVACIIGLFMKMMFGRRTYLKLLQEWHDTMLTTITPIPSTNLMIKYDHFLTVTQPLELHREIEGNASISEERATLIKKLNAPTDEKELHYDMEEIVECCGLIIKETDVLINNIMRDCRTFAENQNPDRTDTLMPKPQGGGYNPFPGGNRDLHKDGSRG